MSDKKVFTVLIIEDEAQLRDALLFTFKKEGYNVHVASNGKEGIKEALQHHPDAILLDIVMPVMNGMDMLKELRKDEWGKQALVFILTNLSENREIEMAIEEGAYEYILKTDWSPNDIVARVNKKLNN